MKILVLCDSIEATTGGGKVGILGMCSALSDSGNYPTLVTALADKDLCEHSRPYPIILFKPLLKFFGSCISLSMTVYMIKNIKKFDAVLIHSIYKYSSTMCALLCRMYKVAYIIRPHGSLDSFLIDRRYSYLKKLWIKFIESSNFRYAAAIHFSSDIELTSAKKYINIWKRSFIIPEGISLDFTTHLKTPIPSIKLLNLTNPNAFKLLFLGRFHEKKGISLLLDALAIALAKNPNIHLILAGTGDDHAVSLINQKIVQLDLTKYITFTGHVTDSEKHFLLECSDLFVLPSFGENFGLSIIEAMAYSLPVLISNNTGVSDNIEKHKSGIVVKCDAAEISMAILKVANDPIYKKEISVKGRALFVQDYTLKRMGLDIDAKYKKALVDYA